jgi:prepilin-type N-terminal cleavage/methylation domain-containing protein
MRRAVDGFTLLEIVVTLVLIGLGAALVAPVFRRDILPDDAFPAVIAGARELAVRRAQGMLLQVDDRGAWRLTTIGDTVSIGSGTLTTGPGASRLRITPLGACFDEGSSGTGTWDVIACAPSGGWRQ